MKVTFVGHPLLDCVGAGGTRETTLRALGLAADQPVVALLPGSRRREVEYHLPVMLEAAAQLRRERQAQFLCVRANTIERSSLSGMLERAGFWIPLVEEQRYEAVSASDLVWAASGTATVETALLLKPMVIVYRVSWITYGLARLLVQVDHIGMANIIAGKRIVPELVQSEFSAERLVEESRKLLTNPDLVRATIGELAQLRDKLGQPGAAERVAELAVAMIR